VPPHRPMRSAVLDRRIRSLRGHPFGAALVVAGLVACASAGGREVYQGVRFYASEGAPVFDRWSGGFSDIPVFVVTGDGGITGMRALAVRDALMDKVSGRQELFGIVRHGDVRGDTLGEILWAPNRATDRECVSYTFVPGDSIRPMTTVCDRETVSARETWNPTPLQRTVLEAGGNAVLLTVEDYAGTFRGLRGFVLRCGEGQPPDCS